MLGQRSGRIILSNPEAGNATVIRMLQQPKGGAGYCDSLDILLQWNSAPFTAGDAIPLSIQIKGAGLVIRAFLSRFEIPRPRPSSTLSLVLYADNPRSGSKAPKKRRSAQTALSRIGAITANLTKSRDSSDKPYRILCQGSDPHKAGNLTALTAPTRPISLYFSCPGT